MIRYSNLPILFASIRSDSSAHFRADLDGILLYVGWTHTTTLTDGFVYGINSPQGLTAQLVVQDGASWGSPYDSTFVVFRAESTGGTHPGYANAIRVGIGGLGTRQVVAGICQLFLATGGAAGLIYNSFACGIPALPDDDSPCTSGLVVPPVTELWWSCGGSTDGSAFFGHAITDFRYGPNAFAGASFNKNGATTIWSPDNTAADVTSANMLGLFPLTPLSTSVDQEFLESTNPQQVVTYHTHTFLNVDAMIGWGGAKIQGQLWDAFLQTAAGTLDATQNYQDTDVNGNAINIPCVTWHVSYYSTLQLVTRKPGTAPAIQNVHY